LSGDPSQEYFDDEMVDEVITALSRNRRLLVIAHNSSYPPMRLPGAAKVGRDVFTLHADQLEDRILLGASEPGFASFVRQLPS
jgi:TolB-like protein